MADAVFAEFAARWGAALAREWPNGLAEVKPVWERDLSKLTEQELGRGMSMLKRESWIPNLNRLLELCRPQFDFEQAFYEAQEQMQLRTIGKEVWANPAMYWAVIRYGQFEFRAHAWSVAKTRWVKLLKEEMCKKSEPVPAPMLALPDVGQSTTDRETAKRRLAELQTMLKSKVVSS